MSINYFRQYELRNRDIVTLTPAHEINGISINPLIELSFPIFGGGKFFLRKEILVLIHLHLQRVM